jgi:hypothetical protein
MFTETIIPHNVVSAIFIQKTGIIFVKIFYFNVIYKLAK